MAKKVGIVFVHYQKEICQLYIVGVAKLFYHFENKLEDKTEDMYVIAYMDDEPICEWIWKYDANNEV